MSLVHSVNHDSTFFSCSFMTTMLSSLDGLVEPRLLTTHGLPQTLGSWELEPPRWPEISSPEAGLQPETCGVWDTASGHISVVTSANVCQALDVLLVSKAYKLFSFRWNLITKLPVGSIIDIFTYFPLNTNGKIWYFNVGAGLDPAGPLFDDYDINCGLTPRDSLWVDNIHTAGKDHAIIDYGTMRAQGDVDFYPNDGGRQPGCNFKKDQGSDPPEPELFRKDINH